MKHLSFAVSVVALTWACDGGTRSASPTSPSAPIGPTAPRAAYALSGVVSEVTRAGQAPVEGARVRVSNRSRVETTDKNGFYWIGVSAGVTSVSVSRAGYETVTRDVTIDGDTRLDIQVVRRPDELAVFTDSRTGFSTSDVHDVQEQIVRFNTANELIWVANDTRFREFIVDGSFIDYHHTGYSFQVRFGTRDGERRAYLSWPDDRLTIVDLWVDDRGDLKIEETTVSVPGT